MPFEGHQMHVAQVKSEDAGGVKFLECEEDICPYKAIWDGQTLNRLVPGLPGIGHTWSW